MNEFIEAQVALDWRDLRPSYDVVIVGGGGHGLSIAYHLATRHGITDVAVLERGYIGSGNSGRNTTVIRANYGIPEAVRFYQRSVDLYSRLEEGDRALDNARPQGTPLVGPWNTWNAPGEGSIHHQSSLRGGHRICKPG